MLKFIMIDDLWLASDYEKKGRTHNLGYLKKDNNYV